ncbi:MAG: hypothetical protein JST04_13805 [Bdellovibrionales bacterium]|nr:hypothetical protein [Bdellovibrionales bacterium]
MKRFVNVPRAKKIAILASISLISLTGLLVGRADSDPIDDHADLDVPARYVPRPDELISDEEFRRLTRGETSLALPEDMDLPESPSIYDQLDASISRSVKQYSPFKWVDSFKYTAAGGLIPANPKCKLFLDDKGEYGSYGRIIKGYIEAEQKLASSEQVFLSDEILGMESVPKICPKWKSLDDKTRTKFWVWVFAAIASAESSCNTDIKEVWGVNDTCTGLLQLEKGYSLRAHRGPNCAGVSPKDIRKPYSNLRCGMDIMKGQLVSRNAKDELEFDGRIYPGAGMTATSYWLKLRKANGGTIGKLIRSFTPCGA